MLADLYEFQWIQSFIENNYFNAKAFSAMDTCPNLRLSNQ